MDAEFEKIEFVPWVFLKFENKADYNMALQILELDETIHWKYEEIIEYKSEETGKILHPISINSKGELQTTEYYKVYPEDKEFLYELEEFIIKRNAMKN